MIENQLSPLDFDAYLIYLEGEAVVAVRGELDMSTTELLQMTIEKALGDGPRLVLDLSGMTFLDSTGITVFLRTQERLEQINGSLVLRSLQQQPKIALRAAGLDGYLNIEE